MDNATISNLMLERYKLGELSHEEKSFVDKHIESDSELQNRLSSLKRSDMEFLNKHPIDSILNRDRKRTQKRNTFSIISGICAAALFIGLSFPIIWNQLNSVNVSGDRPKGMLLPAQSAEADLSVYLKTGAKSAVYEGIPLQEGSTIQLAYTVPGVRYGVIFSVDGRSAVTLHYPYSLNGNTQLVANKQTALEEAYMLDDAPNYELFFFVVSKTPLDTLSIIEDAEAIAENARQQPQNIINESKDVFRNYEIKSVYLRKE